MVQTGFIAHRQAPARRRLSLVLWILGVVWALGATPLPAGNYFQGVSPVGVWWPGGIVPYLFDTNYTVTATESNAILAGLREWELAANVKFVPYTNQTNHVLLQFTNDGSDSGYFLLEYPPPSVMMLHGLSRNLMCHEGGHLFGLQHEHQRTDRNSYIMVNPANIIGGTNGEGAAAFVIDTNSMLFGLYDLESVMHYGPDTFTNGLGDSLDPLPQYQEYYHKIGNLALSIGDRAAVANLYGPPTTALTNIVSTTADGGFGSLRAAIYYANDHPGTTIKFDIPMSDGGYSNGVFTIYLIGELPPLVSAGTVIDGATEAGYDSHPIIALDGSRVPLEAGPVSGLHLYGTNCTVQALAFENFSYAGLQLFCSQSVSNRVQGCYFGVEPDGTTAGPNFYAGVIFEFGPNNNFIGGATASARNIISGNTGEGILVSDTGTTGNVVEGNYIGADASGTAAVPNQDGILVYRGAAEVTVGGANDGARNVISGNSGDGIYITDSSNCVVQGNYLGTDWTGSRALPNVNGGVDVDSDAHGITIGGTTSTARNIASGNVYSGIILQGSGVSNNLVQGNYAGTDYSGSNAVPNGQIGIGVWGGASGNFVGGTNAGAANVASGNLIVGILISDIGTGNNVVQGNFAGTDPLGKIAVSNGSIGVAVNGANGNLIGGLVASARNIVSGNGFAGIVVSQAGASNNLVQGNYVGTDATGSKAVPNGQIGLGVWGGATGNILGGANAGSANVVSGNVFYGVFVSDTNTIGNLVEGNLIGVSSTGSNALGNGYANVQLQNGASGNFIGGVAAGEGNIIAFSGSGPGVVLFDLGTTNNAIRGNSIFGNAALGIDLLGDGVTPNHLGFLAGPNDLQNFPVITNVFGEGGSTIVSGTLNTLANGPFFVDVYRNPGPDPSGHGQGQYYVGSVSVSTDNSGNAAFALTNNTGNFSGQYFAATATSALGDTSEFGSNMIASNLLAASAQFTGPLHWSTNGFVFTLTVETNFNYRIQATTNLGGNPVPWVDLTNFLANDASLLFTDSTASIYRARFYRVISP